MPTALIMDKPLSISAVLRNAVTWGAAFAIAGGALVGALTLFAPGTGAESLPERFGIALFNSASWGVRFGLAGAVVGSLFSIAIRVGYRGKRLAEIEPVPFMALGAVVGGVGVPLYLQTMNILSGDGPVAWGLVGDDAVWASVFGAAVAAGSIILARRADSGSTDDYSAELDEGGRMDTLPTAGFEELYQRAEVIAVDRKIED